jgi:hypothetical protein
VPVSSNRRETVQAVAHVVESAGSEYAGPSSNVTLCLPPSLFHVTVSPGWTVTVLGE